MEETREQRQLRQIQKKKKRRQGWITFGLVALLLFYGGYQLYRSVLPPSKPSRRPPTASMSPLMRRAGISFRDCDPAYGHRNGVLYH